MWNVRENWRQRHGWWRLARRCDGNCGLNWREQTSMAHFHLRCFSDMRTPCYPQCLTEARNEAKSQLSWKTSEVEYPLAHRGHQWHVCCAWSPCYKVDCLAFFLVFFLIFLIHPEPFYPFATYLSHLHHHWNHIPFILTFHKLLPLFTPILLHISRYNLVTTKFKQFQPDCSWWARSCELTVILTSFLFCPALLDQPASSCSHVH